MAIDIRHKFVSPKGDGPDDTLLQPSAWNDTHEITMASARLLGRVTTGTGPVEEIPIGAGLVLDGTSLRFDTTYTGWDARYFTETEVNALLTTAANTTATNLTNGLATKEPLGKVTAIRQITVSETAVLLDAGKVIEANHATVAIVYTIPLNDDVAFPIGTRIDLLRYGVAAFSVAPAVGVTIRSVGAALTLNSQYSAAMLLKRAADEWVLMGDIA